MTKQLQRDNTPAHRPSLGLDEMQFATDQNVVKTFVLVSQEDPSLFLAIMTVHFTSLN